MVCKQQRSSVFNHNGGEMAVQPGSAATDFLGALRLLHQDLGIPSDYAQTTQLPLCREPDELVDAGPDHFQRPQRLVPEALAAWQSMRAAALADGVSLFLISAFRGVDYQCELIRRKLGQGRSMGEILQVIAAPGYSEHHTGRAIDLGTEGCLTLEAEFEHTPAFAWLQRRACEFGFVLSYPRGNPYQVSYEPWHWCYRGLDKPRAEGYL